MTERAGAYFGDNIDRICHSDQDMTSKRKSAILGPAHQPSGFAEGQGQPPLSPPVDAATGKVVLPPYAPVELPPRGRTRVGPGGRVVIPAAFRAAAGMEEGAEVMLTLVGKEVRIITPAAAIAQARETLRAHLAPGRSLGDEFLADRPALGGEDE